ncbi:AfsR/SARP family transcriptional regulator [Actinoplanes derwentensis]|uniref:DNA-binding transcriptional activator of the SARP family n=1 Tax=Actinoplanes derwentensis TaxID=113562 RepID=A0A1H2CC71_9ACTN|nr:BTAD domain-containing putative transcriptional regulator [Actinoplanes derwentensis]SDT68088.1 DNA-binding transcriptional activator of the SARP family [Actinoplanes derwentensis]
MRISIDGEPLKVGSPQQQAMMAVLLLRPGGTATAGELVDALWGADLPNSALATLRTYAWRWRQVLEKDRSAPGVLLSHGDGYRLILPVGSVDALDAEALTVRAEKLRADGDLTGAHDHFRRALAMWEGEPLAGLPGPFAGRQRQRLTERRLSLLESRISLDLRLGRAELCVPELTTLTAEHPLRERPYGLLMRAFYFTGRQAEAFAVFRKLHELTVDELGVSPGPEITELHRSMLEGTLDLPSRSPEPVPGVVPDWIPPVTDAEPALISCPAQLPPEAADFTGRESSAAALGAALTSETRQTLGIAMVVGMGGIGKTTLALHVAHRIREAFPHGQLYADLRGGDVIPANPESVLAGFLTALGVDAASMPENLDVRSALFRSLVSQRQILILLDDARDVAQISPLLPGGAGCAVVITSRSRMYGLPATVQVDLEVFDSREAVELLSRVIGARRVAAEPQAAPSIVALCGHLPLAVRIVAARLAARPGWSIATLRDRLADERRRIDELRVGDLAIEAAFELSYQHLAADQARAFALMSTIDAPEVTLTAAAAFLDRDVRRTEKTLESLVDVALLESPAPGRYRYHDLLRVFGRQTCEAEHRDEMPVAFDRMLSFFLATACTALQQAVPGDPVGQALGPVPSTGLHFADLTAARDWARTHFETIGLVVRQVIGTPVLVSAATIPTSIDLLIALSPFGSDPRQELHVGAARTLVRITERTGDLRSRGRAHFLLGNLALAAKNLAEAEVEASHAVSACRHSDDPAILRQALNDLGLVAQLLGQFDEAAGHFDEAVILAERLGHRSGRIATAMNAALCRVRSGRAAEAVAMCHQAIEESRLLGDGQVSSYAHYTLGLAQYSLHRYDEAAACFRRCLDLCVSTGLRARESHARYRLADTLRLLGDPEEASVEAARSLALCDEIGDQRDQAIARMALGRALIDLNRIDEAREHLRQAHRLLLDIGLPEATEVRDLIAAIPHTADG